MIVLRVENDKGIGPYAVGASNPYDSLDDRHPVPGSEGLDPWMFSVNTRFGFSSKQELRAWFGWEDVPSLVAAGCVLAVYEVQNNRIRIGRSQLVFDCSCARLLRRESLAPL